MMGLWKIVGTATFVITKIGQNDLLVCSKLAFVPSTSIVFSKLVVKSIGQKEKVEGQQKTFGGVIFLYICVLS